MNKDLTGVLVLALFATGYGRSSDSEEFAQVRAELDALVVGVGHPQELKWVIYGGRSVVLELTPGFIPVTPHFQFDVVNIGTGSSRIPVVNMSGELVGVVADGMVDRSFSEHWEYGVSDFVEPVVFWDQASLNAATAGRVGGPHVDVVREFIEARVPGLLGTGDVDGISRPMRTEDRCHIGCFRASP